MSKTTNFIIALIYVTVLCSFIAKISISISPLKISFDRPILGLIIWAISTVSLVFMTLKK